MDWNFVLFSAIKIIAAFAILMLCVAYIVLVERRLCAAIQGRLGPNRVGPMGIWQPIADGIKSFIKEDFTPAHVRKGYFWLAPTIVMMPAILNIAIIPFGSKLGNQTMVIADLNVGILYAFGIVSLGVYGIVLAGYAANSKYPFLGGIRASAQMISYEVSMGLSVVPLFMMVGSLNFSDVIKYQQGWVSWMPILPNWSVIQNPILFFCFLIFLAAAFAETNRLPFDMPESEQELAGGYNVEYSSMKFALFFMGEYAAMILASAIMTTLFFGGWTLPIFGLDQPAENVWVGLLHIAIFMTKMFVFMVFFIWVRWMLPRFRYDQLMNLGWERFLPFALANILITVIWLWLIAGQ